MAGNGSARGVGTGPFLIQIDGLPPRYTWQELKDLIRPQASHSVWTDVAINFHARTQKGWVRLKLQSEAGAAYKYLMNQAINGRRLRVELWDITRTPPQFLVRNFDPESTSLNFQTQEVARLVQDPSWEYISPMSPAMSASPGYSPTSLAQATQSMSQMQIAQQYCAPAIPSPFQTQQEVNPYHAQVQLNYLRQQQQQQQQMLAQQAAIQHSRNQPQPYATSASGLPVNIKNGAAVTESRAIFVSKLNYKAKESEIKKLFGAAGKIVSCTVQKDSKSNEANRGHAQIEYETAAQAERAIKMFNGESFMKMRLNVRPDKNATTITPPARSDSRPVIVTSPEFNGSR